MDIASTEFEANGKRYAAPPCPVVVICIDGCADEYLDTSLASGRMPHLAEMLRGGFRGKVRGALPSFTNVNNSCIVTGLPPAQTGICGNYFLDPDSGQEVMMNSSKFLRCGTILAAASRAGRRVAMVTAKEKLRDLLSYEMKGIAFSSEKAKAAKGPTHGIDNVEEIVGRPTPEIYSAEASLFVLQSGVSLIQREMADFLYLSLTDYMQHKFAPDEPESLTFYADMDREIGRLLETGALLAATADHGMNAKCGPDGSPNVIYLESTLKARFGEGIKVICPITDPYVVHHGALGSLVMVHLDPRHDRQAVEQFVLELEGVTEVATRELAVRKMELAADRIGDLVVLAGRDYVLGRTPADHDLTQMGGTLRSHGGRYEEMVPLLLSRPLRPDYRRKADGDPRNFDIFDFTCNGAVL